MSSRILTAPNQLTLLRLVFIPFIVMTVLDAKYRWALGLFVLAGITDALDGLLARKLQQRTQLGEYLDPIADKLLLSTLFLVLSFKGQIPWKITGLVFSRDVTIVVTSAVLYATGALRDFRPSVFGKANTFAQIAAIFFVLVAQSAPQPWLRYPRHFFLWSAFALTIVSGVHYIFLAGRRMREEGGRQSAAVSRQPGT